MNAKLMVSCILIKFRNIIVSPGTVNFFKKITAEGSERIGNGAISTNEWSQRRCHPMAMPSNSALVHPIADGARNRHHLVGAIYWRFGGQDRHLKATSPIAPLSPMDHHCHH
jgi:hypothetical protein